MKKMKMRSKSTSKRQSLQRIKSRRCIWLLLSIILASATSAALCSPLRFTVTELPTLGGRTSDAYAINDKGQAVGEAQTRQRSLHAVRWEDGRVSDLGVPPGFFDSRARGINGKGDIVGSANHEAYDENGQAVLWQNGHLRLLSVHGAAQSTAVGVNDAGEVVGSYSSVETDQGIYVQASIGENPRPVIIRACAWQDGIEQNLGVTADSSTNAVSGASAVSNSGIVVGTRSLVNLPSYAIVWSGAGEVVLGQGTANAVNGRGMVSGYTIPLSGRSRHSWNPRACLWVNGKKHDLGLLPRYTSSMALALNDAGDVVGEEQRPGRGNSTERRAFLWRAGHKYDLNVLLPAHTDWLLQTARGINRTGQIVGVGLYHGQQRGFLLTPVTDGRTKVNN